MNIKYGYLVNGFMDTNNNSDLGEYFNGSYMVIDGRNFQYHATDGTRGACQTYYDDLDCQDIEHEISGAGRITDVFVNGVRTGVVPEPSTWVLLIAGFGFAGLRLRRERQMRPGKTVRYRR